MISISPTRWLRFRETRDLARDSSETMALLGLTLGQCDPGPCHVPSTRSVPRQALLHLLCCIEGELSPSSGPRAEPGGHALAVVPLLPSVFLLAGLPVSPLTLLRSPLNSVPACSGALPFRACWLPSCKATPTHLPCKHLEVSPQASAPVLPPGTLLPLPVPLPMPCVLGSVRWTIRMIVAS